MKCRNCNRSASKVYGGRRWCCVECFRAYNKKGPLPCIHTLSGVIGDTIKSPTVDIIEIPISPQEKTFPEVASHP